MGSVRAGVRSRSGDVRAGVRSPVTHCRYAPGRWGSRGFPAEAVTFYEGLGADNSRAYWQANKDVYVQPSAARWTAGRGRCRRSGRSTSSARTGTCASPRTRRRTRTTSPRTARARAAPATTSTSRPSGMFAGSGYYHMASDQLERFRAAVDDDGLGPQIERSSRCCEAAACGRARWTTLKTAPRGYAEGPPADRTAAPQGTRRHPRVAAGQVDAHQGGRQAGARHVDRRGPARTSGSTPTSAPRPCRPTKARLAPLQSA